MCNSLERLYEEKGINCNFSTFHLVVIYPLFIDFGMFSKNKKKCTIFFECSYPNFNTLNYSIHLKQSLFIYDVIDDKNIFHSYWKYDTFLT